MARCKPSPKALLQHTPSLEAPARPASLPLASAEHNVIVADAQATRRDEGDTADQAATSSGLWQACTSSTAMKQSRCFGCCASTAQWSSSVASLPDGYWMATTSLSTKSPSQRLLHGPLRICGPERACVAVIVATMYPCFNHVLTKLQPRPGPCAKRDATMCQTCHKRLSRS